MITLPVPTATSPIVVCTETTWGQHATIISGTYDPNNPGDSDMSVQKNVTVKDYRGNNDGMGYLFDNPDSVAIGSIFFNLEDSSFYVWTGAEWAELFSSGD